MSSITAAEPESSSLMARLDPGPALQDALELPLLQVLQDAEPWSRAVSFPSLKPWPTFWRVMSLHVINSTPTIALPAARQLPLVIPNALSMSTPSTRTSRIRGSSLG